MVPLRSPLLFQIRASVLVSMTGGDGTFHEVPDTWLQALRSDGFDWLYILGVWETSTAGTAFSALKVGLLDAANAVCSPFAIADYSVQRAFGGNDALSDLKRRANAVGLQVMVDFVSNHLAVDHSWTIHHPELLVQGLATQVSAHPGDYFSVPASDGASPSSIGATDNSSMLQLAHGRDPYCGGWKDTVQLNYRHPACRAAMTEVLVRIARTGLADGVRCDMAMLELEDVFESTWPLTAVAPLPQGVAPAVGQFWSSAIAAARKVSPEFKLMAEVYWDRESDLLALGFDWTYDKTLYDRLVRSAVGGEGVVAHLQAPLPFQHCCARFIENHDEPRAAALMSPSALAANESMLAPAQPDQGCAAAVIALTSPGLRFIHDGQMEGRRIFHSMHIGPRPPEASDCRILAFYRRLLPVVALPEFKYGRRHLAAVTPSKDGNSSWKNLVAWVVTSAPSAARESELESAAIDTHAQTTPYSRAFVALVNFSAAFSDGHIVPTAVCASQSGVRDASPDEAASAATVGAVLRHASAPAPLLSPLQRVPGSVGLASVSPAGTPLVPMPLGRVEWVDHLSPYKASFDAETVLREGFWVRLQPWWAGILELSPLHTA